MTLAGSDTADHSHACISGEHGLEKAGELACSEDWMGSVTQLLDDL